MDIHQTIRQSEAEPRISRFIAWIGSPSSIILHTIFFLIAFSFIFTGVALEKILLVLTTVVSLEAIYLALFIQMTVNRNTESLENVEENVEEIEKDIDEIERDVDEMEKDIDKIEEHDSKETIHDRQVEQMLTKMQSDLAELSFRIESIKK